MAGVHPVRRSPRSVRCRRSRPSPHLHASLTGRGPMCPPCWHIHDIPVGARPSETSPPTERMENRGWWPAHERGGGHAPRRRDTRAQPVLRVRGPAPGQDRHQGRRGERLGLSPGHDGGRRLRGQHRVHRALQRLPRPGGRRLRPHGLPQELPAQPHRPRPQGFTCAVAGADYRGFASLRPGAGTTSPDEVSFMAICASRRSSTSRSGSSPAGAPPRSGRVNAAFSTCAATLRNFDRWEGGAARRDRPCGGRCRRRWRSVLHGPLTRKWFDSTVRSNLRSLFDMTNKS